MARGKNYVNNDRGVHLAAGSQATNGAGASSGGKGKKNNQTMQMCEYGAGCSRPDCIYRHEESGNRNGNSIKTGGGNDKNNNICVLFLAGKCSFKDKGCRKRHPNKDEVARLLVKYKKIRCRFADDCYTDSCLFSHPRDSKDEDPVAFIEPHHFPPLHDGSHALANGNIVAPKPIPNSAWNSAPVGVKGKSGAPLAAAQQHPQHSPPSSTNNDFIPRPLSPSPNSHHQSSPAQQQPMPPQAFWGYPGDMPPSSAMMMPPPPPSQQQYYGGPMPPQHQQPMIDPNTGYPIDLSYFDPQQQQQLQYAMMYSPHPGMPYYGIPMGIPVEATHFNVEAKEFVPHGSA